MEICQELLQCDPVKHKCIHEKSGEQKDAMVTNDMFVESIFTSQTCYYFKKTSAPGFHQGLTEWALNREKKVNPSVVHFCSSFKMTVQVYI